MDNHVHMRIIAWAREPHTPNAELSGTPLITRAAIHCRPEYQRGSGAQLPIPKARASAPWEPLIIRYICFDILILEPFSGRFASSSISNHIVKEVQRRGEVPRAKGHIKELWALVCCRGSARFVGLTIPPESGVVNIESHPRGGRRSWNKPEFLLSTEWCMIRVRFPFSNPLSDHPARFEPLDVCR